MSLSLLRGTQSPDPKADIGIHRLRYALFLHGGNWRANQYGNDWGDFGTVNEAASFNRTIIWAKGTLPQSMLRPPVSVQPLNVVIDTIKPAEDGKGWVVRLYESAGAATNAKLSFGVPVARIERSNTLEDGLGAVAVDGNACALPLHPFQIVTLRVE
jgi:alpha-mannosidase